MAEESPPMGAEVKLLCLSTTSQKIKRQEGCAGAHTVDRCSHPDLAKRFVCWESVRENEIWRILKARTSYAAVLCLGSGGHLTLTGFTVNQNRLRHHNQHNVRTWEAVLRTD